MTRAVGNASPNRRILRPEYGMNRAFGWNLGRRDLIAGFPIKNVGNDRGAVGNDRGAVGNDGGLLGMTGGLSGMLAPEVFHRGLPSTFFIGGLPSTFFIKGGTANRLMGYPMDFKSNLVCHRRSMVALRN